MADSIDFTLDIGCTEVCRELCHRNNGLMSNMWQQNPWHQRWEGPWELQVQSQSWRVTDRVSVVLV